MSRRAVGAFFVLAIVALVLATAPASAQSSTCALDRSQAMVAGTTVMGLEDVSYATEDIPDACWEAPFSLEGSNLGDDFDVTFVDADGNKVGASATPGDENGTIPDKTAEAQITYWAGVGGSYSLTAGDTSASPVTGYPNLFLRSGPTGVGPADILLGDSSMNQNPPQDGRPDVWRASMAFDGLNPNTIHEANWRWAPQGGFNITNATVDATFWAASSAGKTLGTATFEVLLYVDGDEVASKEVQASPPSPTEPAKFTPSFTVGDIAGDTLTFQVDPIPFTGDAAHVILYNSTQYPSGLDFREISLGSLEDVPDVVDVGANHVQLDWDPAQLGDLDHYRVYRSSDGSQPTVVATPDEASVLDRSAEPATTYTYEVAAVNYAGNEVVSYETVNVTTDAPDDTAPTIADVTVEAGTTTAIVSFDTDELADGRVEFGPTSDHTQVRSTGPAEEHELVIGGLEPGETTHLNVNVTDMAGNADETGDLTVTTDGNWTLWFHNEPGQGQFLDEFDTAGDQEPTYNDLGGALATANGQDAVTALPVRDVFPTRPDRPATVSVGDGTVNATVYVKDLRESPQDDPRGGELRVDAGSPNRIELELTLLANGGEVLAQGTVHRTLVGETGWTPFEFTLDPQLETVESGSLKAILRPETATSGFAYGYEGGHASNVTVPLEAGLTPQATVDTSPETVVAGTQTTLTADTVGVAEPAVSWDLDGDGTGDATGTQVTHTFAEEGETTVTLTVTDGVSGASATVTETIPVRQGDFVNDSRTVVAVVDTGINPYHPVYQRPGIDLPLDDFQNHTGDGTHDVRTVDLADSGTWEDRVKSYRKDRATWNSIGKGDLVHFEGTNVLGVSFADGTGRKILDSGSHGTWTSSTVLETYPDAIIVAVQIDAFLSLNTDDPLHLITRGYKWAESQPWIDVVTASLGTPTNAPTPSEIPEVTKEAVREEGKIWIGSAGNDPSPSPTDTTDGPPWILSITGSQADGRSHEVMSSNFYPDYTADYTVTAADSRTTEDQESRIGGTSFSAPTVAGTVAGIIQESRQARDHDGGIQDGNLVKGAGPASPAIDNADVRDVLNRTAVIREDPTYVAGVNYNGDHAHPPGAEHVTAHWGHVDERIIPDATADLLQDDLDVPVSKTDVWLYKQQTHQTRQLYWENVGTET